MLITIVLGFIGLLACIMITFYVTGVLQSAGSAHLHADKTKKSWACDFINSLGCGMLAGFVFVLLAQYFFHADNKLVVFLLCLMGSVAGFIPTARRLSQQ